MGAVKTESRVRKYLASVAEGKEDSWALAQLAALDHLDKDNPSIAGHIIQELKDQRAYLKLIASENYCSPAVQLAMGNWLTDKYAEGYPHHRFYAGCENVDAIEDEAISELKKLFNAEAAYVQPHSGADANTIAFWAILMQRLQSQEMERLSKKSIDQFTTEEHEHLRQLMVNQKLLAMGLNSGGHLTHGYRLNFSSKIFKALHYEVDAKTELLDYEAIRKQAKQEKPLILLAGYSAYPRCINFAIMRQIADEVGATLMVDMAHFSGLVAGKLLVGDYDPVSFADIVTSTTHKTLRGPRGGIILCKEELAPYVNKGCPLAIGGPLPHVIAAKAVAFREASSPSFRTYAKRIVDNAIELAEALKKRGVRLVTDGTENHLLVLDVSSFGITGRQAEKALREAHVTVNRNTVPFDQNGPWYTSGVRIGTPAMTTLGMESEEMDEIADIIVSVLKETKPASAPKSGGMSKSLFTTTPKAVQAAKERVGDLLARFPLYPELPLE